MQTKQATGIDFIEEWVLQKLVMGRTIDEMNGTTFVYGNELLTLKKNADGAFDLEPFKVPEVIFLDKPGKEELADTCFTCGMEHHSHKAALECCANVD